MTGANCLSKSETSRNLIKLATGIFINQNGGGIAANKLPLCLKNATFDEIHLFNRDTIRYNSVVRKKSKYKRK